MIKPKHPFVMLLHAGLATGLALIAAACNSSENFIGPLTTDDDPIELLCGTKTDTAIDQLRPEPTTPTDTMPSLGTKALTRRPDGGACTYQVGTGSVELAFWDSATNVEATTRYQKQRATRRVERALDVKGLADRAELLDDGSVIVQRNDRILFIDLATRPTVIDNAGPALTYFFLDGLCH